MRSIPVEEKPPASVVILGLVLHGACWIAMVYMTRDMFNWFLAEPFHMPALSARTAFGIRAFVGCFKFKYGGDIQSPQQSLGERFTPALAAITIFYGIAWLVAK